MVDEIPEMIDNAETLPGGGRLITAIVEGDQALLRDLASKIIETDDIAVLLGAENGDRYNFVFARGNALPHMMGKLLSEVAKPFGGKGGGRPDFAQGGGPKEILEAARANLLRQ